MALQDASPSYKARLLIDVKEVKPRNYAHCLREIVGVAAPRLNEALNILVTGYSSCDGYRGLLGLPADRDRRCY